MDAAVLVTKEVRVNEEHKMMKIVDVMEPAASPELGHQVVEAMKKGQHAIYPVCSFHNADFRELMDENELSYESPCWSPRYITQ